MIFLSLVVFFPLQVLHLLLHVHLEPAALAAGAVPHIAPALPLTGGAELVPGGRQLAGLAVVELLKGDPQLVDHGLGLVGLSAGPRASHPPAEHHVEYVHRGAEPWASAPTTSLLDSLLSSLVIDLPLLTVRQNLVRVRDLFELVPGVRILVRVKLHGELPVRLLQLSLGGIRLHLQYVVPM